MHKIVNTLAVALSVLTIFPFVTAAAEPAPVPAGGTWTDVTPHGVDLVNMLSRENHGSTTMVAGSALGGKFVEVNPRRHVAPDVLASPAAGVGAPCRPRRHCGALRANRARRLLGPTRTTWSAVTSAGEGALLGHE